MYIENRLKYFDGKIKSQNIYRHGVTAKGSVLRFDLFSIFINNIEQANSLLMKPTKDTYWGDSATLRNTSKYIRLKLSVT